MSVQNTSAILKAANKVTLELIKVIKKGGGPVAEVLELVSDLESQPDFMQAMKDAIAAFPNEGTELKSLTTADAIALVVQEAQAIPDIIAAVHG